MFSSRHHIGLVGLVCVVSCSMSDHYGRFLCYAPPFSAIHAVWTGRQTTVVLVFCGHRESEMKPTVPQNRTPV